MCFSIVAPAKQKLQLEVRRLVKQGIKPNTIRAYTSAQQQYMDFCCIYEFDSMPACQDTLLSYVAYLNNRCLKHGSISVYLAAVRSMHIEAGYPNPLENFL